MFDLNGLIMSIGTTELEKIERLLNSTDEKNTDLALTILSGFNIDDESSRRLFNYYKELENTYQHTTIDLQSIILGTLSSSPTKASRLLTMLFEKSSISFCLTMLASFVNNNTITFPRLDLTDFPKVLSRLSTIEHIVWQHGNLSHLSDFILSIPNIQSLDLRHQPLLTIDEKITQHPRLKELWIGNALIVSENLAADANFDIIIEAAY